MQNRRSTKTNRILSLMLALIMTLGLMPVTPITVKAATPIPNTDWYYTPTGVNTYSISTADELAGLAELVNGGDNFSGKIITLTTDIDLSTYGVAAGYNSGAGWTPIGNTTYPFSGTFDGNGHVITNLTIDSSAGYVGLFGIIGSGGAVKNLGIASNSSVKGTGTGADIGNVGGLAGYNNGTITNCYNSGTVTGTGNGIAVSVGGLAGRNFGTGAKIENCYNSGTVTGTGTSNDTVVSVGGLAGGNNDTGAKIENCYYDKEKYTGNAVGSGTATNSAGLTTAQMVMRNVLNGGAMPDLDESIWSKRGANENYCYYPELKVFYTGTVTQQAASAESAQVTRLDVTDITTPTASPINQGQLLSASTLTGGDSASVHGTFAWENGNFKPTVTGDYNAIFTPDPPNELYKPTTVLVSVTVNAQIQPPPAPTYYTVTFVDWNGKVLDTQSIKHGEAAIAPANPTRDGYTFIGWNTPFSNITGNLTVTAQYRQNGQPVPTTYTVIFKDWEGTTLSTQTIAYGNSATAPANPIREGYTFIGWNTPFSNITGNLTVTAQYRQNGQPVPTTYTVIFKDWEGTTLSTQTIAYGNSATAPANPIREGYTFIGWNDAFNNITGNLTVTAVYMQNTQLSGNWTSQQSPSSQQSGSTMQTPPHRIITIKDRNGNVIDSFDTSVLSPNGKILTLKPSKQSNSYVFSFNLQCLKELETAMKGGKFKITLSGIEYELPFNMASIITGLSNYLRNENLQSYTLELTITKLTGDELAKAQDAFRKAFPDSEMPDAFYDISFGLYKNGKKVNYNANQFNSAMIFSINTSGKYNAVLEYNPTTGRFSFVPARFSENKASVTTRHHSIYAAVKNNVNFADVKAGAWYEPYVTAAANMALVEGVGGGLFDPERAVTRAEFVQMIANAMQLPLAKDGTKEYTDVAKTAWYYDAIMRANSAGLLNGFTGDGFKPEEAITREEMASILAAVARSEKLSTTGVSLEQTFADFGEMGEKYREDIELVYSAKLMDGVGNGCFNPKGSTTRAQAATVQIRLLELLNMIG